MNFKTTDGMQDWKEIETKGVRVVFVHGSVDVQDDNHYICLDFRESPLTGRYISMVFSKHNPDNRWQQFCEVLRLGGNMVGHWTDVTCKIDEDQLRWVQLSFRDYSPDFSKLLSLIITVEQMESIFKEVEKVMKG